MMNKLMKQFLAILVLWIVSLTAYLDTAYISILFLQKSK